MAEELETQAATVGDGDSQESAKPTGEQAQGRQPKQQTKVNLDEMPEFRQWKSVSDKQIAQAQQAAQQANQRMKQLEQQVHQLSIRDLPEDEQRVAVLQRELQEERAARVDAQNYIGYLTEQQKANQRIDAGLAKITARTGFPLEEARRIFNETGDADEAWAAAYEWASDGRRNRRSKADEDDDDDPGVQRAKANRVDTGTGKAKSAADERQQAIRKAMESRDATSYYRAMLANKN